MRDSNLAQNLTPESESNRPVLTTVNGGKKNSIDPLDEVTMRKTKRQHIREFGMVIAGFMVLLAAIKLFRNGDVNTILTLCGCASLFFSMCIWTPRLMIPVFKGWMKFGGVLEKITTRIILGTLWFATFFPLGIVFRMIGKSTLTLGFEPDRKSYWENCENGRNDFQLLERQY